MTSENSSERYKICEACDRFNSTLKICKECGCFMPAKVMIPIVSCPLGKWGKSKTSWGAEQ